MDWLNLFGGVALLASGIFLTTKQILTIKAGTDDKQGFDIKLLGGGIGLVMVGIGMIIKYI